MARRAQLERARGSAGLQLVWSAKDDGGVDMSERCPATPQVKVLRAVLIWTLVWTIWIAAIWFAAIGEERDERHRDEAHPQE